MAWSTFRSSDWESWHLFLGMMGKQVRRKKQNEMPVVIDCSLPCHCKMDMKSSQKVLSRLYLLLDLFSIFLTFIKTEVVSKYLCEKSCLETGANQKRNSKV